MQEDLHILFVLDLPRLEITFKAALTLPAVQEIAKQSKIAIEKYQCTQILFDIRQTLSIISPTQNFEIIHNLQALGWQDDERWAILYQNDAHIYTIAAQLLKQRGIDNIAFFTDRAAALAWLQSKAEL